MRGEFYLVAKEKKRPLYTLGVRLTDRAPKLSPGEIAIKVTLELPDSLFKKTAIRAKISIPEDRVMPMDIDAKVVENITDTLKANLGMDLNITVEGN